MIICCSQPDFLFVTQHTRENLETYWLIMQAYIIFKTSITLLRLLRSKRFQPRIVCVIQTEFLFGNLESSNSQWTELRENNDQKRQEKGTNGRENIWSICINVSWYFFFKTIPRKLRQIRLRRLSQLSQWSWKRTAYKERAEVSERLSNLFIMVIGPSGVQFGLWSYEWSTKSDDREAGVRFVNDEYDYKQNWTTRSPVTH